MTSISKNVFIDEIDDIVNKYNNTYHRTIKTKLVAVKPNTYINSSKKLMMKILNSKLMLLLEYQNIKNVLTKGYISNWSKKILLLEVKNTLNHISNAKAMIIYWTVGLIKKT